MAEIKNAFIQSKMNKDLDARLLPSGEYRNAVNAQVSKSEGSDVGALQNILGNELIFDFIPGVEDLISIGFFADATSNTVYVFLTNNTGSDYDPAAENYICSYNITTSVANTLVQGAFLNFSTLNPIYGVNLLENLLFWTDNRNQPRKINVLRALGYYTKEDQISVAKISPYKSLIMWQDGAGGYETTMKDVSSKSYPSGGDGYVDATATLDTWTLTAVSGAIPVGATVGIVNNLGLIDNEAVTVVSYDTVTQVLVLSAAISLTNGDNIVFNPNPYYNGRFFGDPDFLKDKFVRFSYRYRFDDGEYSIFAPFTQIAFIPQQDGYFMYIDDPSRNDEESAFRSTEVAFVQNKVTEIDLLLELPVDQSVLVDETKIVAIDILYKESDALAVKVVETIPINAIVNQDPMIPGYYSYKYNSQKPYKTLPSNELIRVYDKIPVKALSQEIISNRVVYGNYQDKHTPPAALNYNVAVTTKSNFSELNNTTSIVEYPNHSVKQNRSYQVGVVLSDKFGRQSTVLLTSNTDSITVGDQTYSGSTVYYPYINEAIDPDSWPGASIKMLFNDPVTTDADPSTNYPGVYIGDDTLDTYNPLGWYSYKIVVKQTEQDYYNVYLPGVMAAYPENIAKELGKTSHTVLINDNINKVPRDLSEVGPVQRQFRSSVRLYGRVENNIDAVTKNNQYYPGRESSIVSTIADNNDLFNGEGDSGYVPSLEFYNIESNPLIGRISTRSKLGVTSAEDVINLAVLETEPVDSLLDIFWETATSGLISELNEAIYADTGGEPRLSALNSSGFNEGIALGDYVFNASFYLIRDISTTIPGIEIDSFELIGVENFEPTPLDVSSYFNLQDIAVLPDPTWNITVTSDFIDNAYYGENLDKRKFKFTFKAVVNGITQYFYPVVNLNNIAPSILVCPATIDTNPSQVQITYFDGENGCGNSALQALDLNWDIASAEIAGSPGTSVGTYFSIYQSIVGDISRAVLINNLPGALPVQDYNITVRLSDAGGTSVADECAFLLTLGFVPESVKQYTWTLDLPGENTEFADFVIIHKTGVGYYAFNHSWSVLSAGTNTIYIPSSGYSCVSGWLFGTDLGVLCLDMADCIFGISGGAPYIDSTINTSGYTFSMT